MNVAGTIISRARKEAWLSTWTRSNTYELARTIPSGRIRPMSAGLRRLHRSKEVQSLRAPRAVCVESIQSSAGWIGRSIDSRLRLPRYDCPLTSRLIGVQFVEFDGGKKGRALDRSWSLFFRLFSAGASECSIFQSSRLGSVRLR